MARVDEKTGKIIYDRITKPEVVQANYLACMKDDSHVDDAIAFYTGLMPWNWGTIDASHTEKGFWLDGELWFCSSTSRSDLGAGIEDGTRWIKGSDLLRNPERWHLQVKKVYVYSGSNNIQSMVYRANYLMGLRYDFYGVGADFTNPVRVFIKRDLYKIKIPKKIYCSKFAHVIDTGWLVVFSPKRKYLWAKKNGYLSVEDTYEFLIARGVLNEKDN